MTEVRNPIQRTTEQRMDMRSLLEVLIRRRWIVLLVALPVILVAVFGTMRGTQLFRARTTLIIETAGPSNPSFYTPRVDQNMVLSSAAEIGMSAPVSALAAEALMDSLPMFKERDPDLFDEIQTLEDMKKVVHDGVECNHVGESNLLSLSFAHPNAGFSMLGAKALSTAFIDFQISSRQNSPAVEYYTDQINATMAEIDSLMAIRVAILDSTGLVGMQVDLRTSFTQIRDLETQYFNARSRREGIEAKINQLRLAIELDPDFIPATSYSESSSLYRLKSELDERQARLTELRQRYQEESTWVQREVEQLEAIRSELFRERRRFIEGLQIDLAQAQSMEQSLHQAYRAKTDELATYPAIRGQIETVDDRLDGLRKLLSSLQIKRGEVRMAADSDMRISDILLLEEPQLDVPVGRGRKILYLVIAVILALAMGLVVAFFVEGNDHRIYDRRRAEMYLEVPVLGSLPDATGKSRL